MQIRPAEPGDLGFCHDCARWFIDETRHRVAYDAETAHRTLWAYITDPDREILVSDEGGVVLGGVMLARVYEFTRQPFCYLVKLYVAPEARGSCAARALLKATQDWAASHGCSHVFANAGAGFGPRLDAVTGNLYRRSGFDEAGMAFVKPVGSHTHERNE